MGPQNQNEQENHLNQTSILRFHVSFPGGYFSHLHVPFFTLILFTPWYHIPPDVIDLSRDRRPLRRLFSDVNLAPEASRFLGFFGQLGLSLMKISRPISMFFRTISGGEAEDKVGYNKVRICFLMFENYELTSTVYLT